MAPPKIILQLYPMLPAEDEFDRARKRPLGRNRELYNGCCTIGWTSSTRLKSSAYGVRAQSSIICIRKATRWAPTLA